MGKESDTDQPAEIVREYGPFPGAPRVHGVSFDGSLVWFASGEKLQAFEPASGGNSSPGSNSFGKDRSNCQPISNSARRRVGLNRSPMVRHPDRPFGLLSPAG